MTELPAKESSLLSAARIRRPSWPKTIPSPGTWKGGLLASDDHLAGAEIDVDGGRPVRDERVPGAEERVHEGTVEALPDRRAVVVVVGGNRDLAGAGEGDVERAGAVAPEYTCTSLVGSCTLAGGWAAAAVSGNTANAADAVSIPRIMMVLFICRLPSGRRSAGRPDHPPGDTREMLRCWAPCRVAGSCVLLPRRGHGSVVDVAAGVSCAGVPGCGTWPASGEGSGVGLA